MKKFLFLLFFCVSPVLAQEMFSGEPVYLNNGETVEVDVGVPIIFTNQEAKKEVFEPEKVQWKPQLATVEISAFAGQRIQVPFVTHIPAFTTFVQFFPDRSVVITERIILVNDQPLGSFKKQYLKTQAKDPKKSARFDFLFASSNGKTVYPFIKETDETLDMTFFADEGLSTGVHLIEISYKIENAVELDGVLARMQLPIVDGNNPFISERGQVLLTFPKGTKFLDVKALYGKNNLTSDKAGDFYKDENEHLIYKMKGLLPAEIGLKLEIMTDSNVFAKIADDTISEKTAHYAWFIALLIGCFVLYCYLFFAALDLKDSFISKTFLNKIRAKLKYDIMLYRPLILGKTDVKAFLVSVLFLFQRKNIDIRLINNDILLSQTGKATNKLHKRVLGFIFGRFKKKIELNTLDWNKKGWKKFRRIVYKAIKAQQFRLMQRETIISTFLCILVLGFVCYLDANVWQILISLGVLLIFMRWQLASLQRRAHLRNQLVVLFKEYANISQNEERQFLTDIALENKSGELTGLKESVNLPFDEFEKLFVEQLTVKEKK